MRYIQAISTTLAVCMMAALVACSSGSSSSTGGGGGGTTPISVALTGAPASLAASGTASITATVSNDSAAKGVTWSCTPASSCGSFNPTATASGTATTYTAPGAAGSVVVTATSVSDTTKTASATISVTVAQVSLADGNYVFALAGNDTAPTFYNVAGVFTVSGGIITGGEQDFVDGNNTDLHDAINPTGSNYTTTTDGNLQLTLTTCLGTVCTSVDPVIGGGTGIETINGSVVSTSTCGTAGGPCRARLTEFDTFATSTGTLDLQDSTAAATAPAGTYAMGIEGGEIAIGGILNISGTSVSTTGTVLDFNLAGVPYAAQTITTGSVSAPDATGRLQISVTPTDTTDLPVVNLAAYIVDSSRIDLMAASAPLGGIAYSQNTGNLGVSGNSYVAGLTGFDGLGLFEAAGVFTMGSTGTVTGTISSNDGGNNQSPASAISGATYVADATNLGRYTITGVTYTTAATTTVTLNMQLYVDGNGNAVLLTMDAADVLGGVGYLQTPSASFSGNYAMADTGADVAGGFPLNAVGPVATGSGTFSGFADVNWFGTSAPTPDVTVSGAFTAPSGGVSTGTGNAITGLDATTPANADAFDYYVVDSTKVIAIDVDGNLSQLDLVFFEVMD